MKKELISKLDLAVILSISVGICYVLTYLNYAGEFMFYGLPFHFIDVGSKEVLFTMLLYGPIIGSLLYNILIDTSPINYVIKKDINNIKRLNEFNSNLKEIKLQIQEDRTKFKKSKLSNSYIKSQLDLMKITSDEEKEEVKIL